jgi:hypothetical protein
MTPCALLAMGSQTHKIATLPEVVPYFIIRESPKQQNLKKN